MAVLVKFKVEGLPIPQGSFRHVGNGRIISANSKLDTWRTLVALNAKNATTIRNSKEAVVMVVLFFLPRPKSNKRLEHTTKPDLDKLLRSIFDAVSLERYCQILNDDSQVVHVTASKEYSANGWIGAEIVIYN